MACAGPAGELLQQLCRLCVDACCTAFKPAAPAGAPPPLPPPYGLPAMRLAGLLAPYTPPAGSAALAAGPLLPALHCPAAGPHAMAALAHTARLSPVPVPLFHAALRAATAPGASPFLRHAAFGALTTAFRILFKQAGGGAGGQALLLPGMVADAGSPAAASLRSYVKGAPDPAVTARHAACVASGALQAQAAALRERLGEHAAGPGARGGAAAGGAAPRASQPGMQAALGLLSTAARELELLQAPGTGRAALAPGGSAGAQHQQPGGLAEVGAQCKVVRWHLDALEAVAQRLGGGELGAGQGAGVGGLKGAAMKLQDEAAELAASCKRLAQLLGQ